MIPITLLKEYVYCPRIAYYKLFSIYEPATESMRYAKVSALSSTQLVAVVKQHIGEEFTLIIEAPVQSKRLRLSGKVDAVALTQLEAVPIEVKLETSPEKIKKHSLHHLVQIVAYAIATEETFGKIVKRALVVSSDSSTVFEIRLSPALRELVYRLSKELWRIVEEERIPRPTASRRKCAACFYRKFCTR